MSNGTTNSTTSSLVSLGWSASQVTFSEGVVFVPWLAVITAALDILELAGVIPDPIALLLSLFAGRPREQASIQQAQRLMTARNPAARLMGIQLTRMVNEWDVVTSEGGSGRVLLDDLTAQFEQNMVAQGVALERSKQLVVNAFSEAAQSGLALEPELLQPLPSQLGFNGPSPVASSLMTQYQKAIAAGKSIADALKSAEAYVWKNTNLRLLFQLQVGPFIPTTPPAPQVIPGADGSCPSGYTLDATTELCTIQGQSTGPKLGTPPPTAPPVSQPDPDGDEITDDLCAQMAANTTALINAIGTISPGAPADTECCANIVTAIGNVITTLGSIASAVAGISPGAGVDLSGVTSAIEDLASAVKSIAPAAAPDLTPIVQQLTKIANEVGNASPADLKPIVDAINAFAKIVDVKPATIQYLVDQGFIDSDLAQTVQSADFGDWAVSAFRTAGWKALRWALSLIGITWNGSTFVLGTVPKELLDIATGLVGKTLTFQRNTLWGLVTPLLDTFVSALSPTAVGPIGDIGVDEDTVIADAASLAMNIYALTAAVGAIDGGLASQLDKIADIVTAIMGVEELTKGKLAALINNGISKVSDLRAKMIFRQELPSAGALSGWRARGLLDSGTFEGLLGYTGLPPQLHDAQVNGSYGGLNARMMIRMLESGLFTQGDIVDELTFAGMRAASQKRLLTAAPWLATVSERNQLKAALENAYVNGLLSDLDLSQQLAQLNQDTDGDGMVLARVQSQKRVAFVKELEAGYRQQFSTQLINAVQYQGLLEGIGLQPDWVSSRIAADTAKLAATTYRKEVAAELALERATAAKERSAAVKNFTSGNINAVALAAALLLTGLNPTQAAAWVDLAVLQKAGSLRWIFGLQLASPQATLLRSRVSALSDQRKRLQITDAAFVSALQALGIPEHYINVLKATADAMITPKTAAVTIPVETS